MEASYGDVTEEYQVVRQGCGLVDYAGTGVYRVSGPGAAEFLSRICSRSVDFLLEGQILSALLVDDDGALISDVLVHCEADGFRLEVWPDRTAAAGPWLSGAAGSAAGVTVDDISGQVHVYGLEGPRSPGIARTFLSFPISSMAYPSFVMETWQEQPILVSRTGVSGEYGFKFHVPVELAEALATALVERGAVRVGREALDICRMEMRFVNLERETPDGSATPFSVGLQWMVDFGHEFRGRESLLNRRQTDPGETLVCWQAQEETQVPTRGTPLLASGSAIGTVRHAVFSPGLNRVIGVAALDADLAASGLDLALGEPTVPVRTISAPFLVATSLNTPLE